MDITKLTVVELKAMVYDQMVVAEQTQNNIKALNTEIQKKLSEGEQIITSPELKEKALELAKDVIEEKLKDNKA